VSADLAPLEQGLAKAKAQAVALSNSLGGRALTNFSAGIGQAAKNVEGLGRSMHGAASEVVAFGKSFLPFLGITAALGGLVKSFRDFASEQRDITVLATQIKLLGTNVGITIDQLEDFTDALKRQTGFTDDSIRSAERLGLQLGLTGKSLFDLTKLATDLATVMGSDVPSAMQTLARVANQPVETLRLLKREMNISPEVEAQVRALDKLGDRAGAANLLLNALQGRIGGIAASVHDSTAQGALDDLSNAMNDLSESVGGLLAKPEIIQFLHDLAAGINDLGNHLGDFGSYTEQKGEAAFFDFLRKLGAIDNSVIGATGGAPGFHVITDAERRGLMATTPSSLFGPLPATSAGTANVPLPQERPIHIEAAAVATQKLADTTAHAAAETKKLTDAQQQLVEELNTAQSVTRDFLGTFVHDLVDGKNAVDSITDALKNLQNRLIDIALDKVVQGLFAGLLGGGGSTGLFSGMFAARGASGGVFATGGVVGSTPVPSIRGHGKLKYDEFPAILHVGERVIPAGGNKPQVSGRQVLEMFGGRIPSFAGGLGVTPSGNYTYENATGYGASGQVTGTYWSATAPGRSFSYDSGPPLSSGGYGGFGGGGGGRAAPRAARFAGYPISPPVVRDPIIGIALPSLVNYGMPTDLVPFDDNFSKLFSTPPRRWSTGSDLGTTRQIPLGPVPPSFDPYGVGNPNPRDAQEALRLGASHTYGWPTVRNPIMSIAPTSGTRDTGGPGRVGFFPRFAAAPPAPFTFSAASRSADTLASFLPFSGRFDTADDLGVITPASTVRLSPFDTAARIVDSMTIRGVPTGGGFDSPVSGGSTAGDIGQPYGGAGGTVPYDLGFGGAYRRQRLPGYHHKGGYVGSSPAGPVRGLLGELWSRAPRLHAGLQADEYPAVLQAGERVIPRGGESASPKVTVTVNNYGSAQVETNTSSDGNGGIKIDIELDRLVAAKMRDGGSQISRQLASMGSRATPVRR
jgi:hypothetical protein